MICGWLNSGYACLSLYEFARGNNWHSTAEDSEVVA